MDMRISGSGTVSAGEYDDIRISGSGRTEGLVRCNSFHASGSFSGDELECIEEIHISGSGKLEGNLSAESCVISGAFTCSGNITIKDSAAIAGAIKCEKNIKCGELRIAGAAKIKGDIEAEKAVITGGVKCGGLINAEELIIKLNSRGDIHANSIGGSKIFVDTNTIAHHPGIFEKIFGWNEGGKLIIEESIEGDEIILDNTEAKTVIGKNVNIGAGCKIGVLQYSGEAVISPYAKVSSVEKI